MVQLAKQSELAYIYFCTIYAFTHKMLQLKEEYFVVVAVEDTSGFTWSDTTGAGREKTHPTWKDYLKASATYRLITILILITTQLYKHANHFRNKSFHLFKFISEMMPSQGKGVHIFCSGSNYARSAVPQPIIPALPSGSPTSATSASSSLVIHIPVATAFSTPPPLTIGIPMAATSQALAFGSTLLPASDPSASPSVPSLFLQTSNYTSDSSLVLTSMSRRKCKVSALFGLAATSTGLDLS